MERPSNRKKKMDVPILDLDDTEPEKFFYTKPSSDRSSHNYIRRVRLFKRKEKHRSGKDDWKNKAGAHDTLPIQRVASCPARLRTYDFGKDERTALMDAAMQYDAWMNLCRNRKSRKSEHWCIVSHPGAIGAISGNFLRAKMFYRERGYILCKRSEVTKQAQRDIDVFCLKRVEAQHKK